MPWLPGTGGGAFLRWGDVRDVGVRGGKARSRDARDDAAREQPRQRRGEPDHPRSRFGSQVGVIQVGGQESKTLDGLQLAQNT